MKEFWRIALIGLIAVFAGCSNKHEDAAREVVLSKLNDPSSAQFSDVMTYDTDVVCGRVNAKNRMGGYTGAQVFIYNGSIAKHVDMDVKQYEIDDWCRNVKPTLAALEKLCADAAADKTPEGQASARGICENRDKYKRDLGRRDPGAKNSPSGRG